MKPEFVSEIDVGEAEFGIINTQENPNRFRFRELFRDHYWLGVNQGHRPHAHEIMRLEELNQDETAVFWKGPKTFDTTASVSRTIGMLLDPAAGVRFQNTLMDLIRHRGLAPMLPTLVVQEGHEDGIRAGPLIAPTVPRTCYHDKRKDRFQKEETAVLEAFLKFKLMAFEKLSRVSDGWEETQL